MHYCLCKKGGVLGVVLILKLFSYLQQPSWKPVLHKGKNILYLALTENIRAVQVHSLCSNKALYVKNNLKGPNVDKHEVP